ncbi:MAG: hypothetical protein LBM93_12180 [Oscillospiraceae bacterium]|jgi:hypothetical protein|nr:hypothetical protein [Oscillospiraceae bacterium]
MSIQVLPPYKLNENLSPNNIRGFDPNERNIIRIVVSSYGTLDIDGIPKMVTLNKFVIAAETGIRVKEFSKKQFCKLIGAEDLYLLSENLLEEHGFTSILPIVSITVGGFYNKPIVNYADNRLSVLLYSVYLQVPFLISGQPYSKEYLIPNNIFIPIDVVDYNDTILKYKLPKEYSI